MGKRRQPRHEIKLPVRVFGTDSDGKVFSENAFTVDISQDGACVTGVNARLRPEEIVGLTYQQKKQHFRVKWQGQPGTPKAGRMGLLNLSPDKPFWDIPLPTFEMDAFKHEQSGERRHFPRVKCSISVELHPEQGAMVWAKAADVSLGGCFVEMSIPFPKGAKMKIGIWVDGAKLWATGKVISSTPGFGVGVAFEHIADAEREILRKFLQSISRVASAGPR
jgi:hypothetical protein